MLLQTFVCFLCYRQLNSSAPAYPVKVRPGREVDHLSPRSAEVQNEWSYNSVPLICLYDVDRDNLLLSYFMFIKNHKNATRVNRKIIWADMFSSPEGSVRY